MDMYYKFEVDKNHIQIKNNNDDLVAFVDLINVFFLCRYRNHYQNRVYQLHH